MNIGKEDEWTEFKKSTSELDSGLESIVSILNKQGEGVLYFGVKNNGDVVGQECSESTIKTISNRVFESIKPIIYPEIKIMKEETIEYIKVSFKENKGPYSAFGRYYLRVGESDRMVSPENLRSMFLAYDDDNSFWEKEDSKETIEDMDKKLINDFYERGKASGRISFPFSSVKDVFSWLGLLCDNGDVNNAGRVLFSKNKPLILKLASYATDERITFLDMDRFQGNIYESIEYAMDFIKKNIHWSQTISDGPRTEEPEIPLLAVKEVIINSFCHEIFNNSVTNEIDIHPSFIEIFNPGRFPEGFVPEDFAYKNIKSIQVNPVIANAMFLGHDIEGYGGGFRRTFGLCDKNGIDYNYQKTNQGFSFFFLRGGKRKAVKEAAQPVSSFENDILSFLKTNPGSQGTEIANKIGKDIRFVQRLLLKLEKKGIIIRDGEKRWTRWFSK